MDYELSEDQAMLMNGLESLLSHYKGDRLKEAYYVYDQKLVDELDASGFLNISREEGFGALDAALVVAEVSRIERVVETSATALIAPAVGLIEPGPYAVTSFGAIKRAIRFLPIARRLIIEDGDRAYEMVVTPDDVTPVQSVMAYPFGRLKKTPDLKKLKDLGPGSGATVRKWRRVALALEGWAAADSALHHTIAYVLERRVFGRVLGSYQAVQHRLALCAEAVAGARWLALKAAFSGDDGDAALAATHLQASIPQLTWDLHQFNGAQSWPLSNPLHFWTFRLRSLQGELGGADQQALAVADAFWG